MARALRCAVAACALSTLTTGSEVPDAKKQTAGAAEEENRACPEFGPLSGAVFLRQDLLSVLYRVRLFTSNATVGTVSRTLFTWGAALELCNARGSLVATLRQGISEDDAELLDCHGQRLATIVRHRMDSRETGVVEGYRLLNDEGGVIGETLDVPGVFLDPLSTALVTLRNRGGELQMHLEQESALVPYGWDMKVIEEQSGADAQVFALFAGMLFPGVMWISLGPGLAIWICVLAILACACYLCVRLGGPPPEGEDLSDDSSAGRYPETAAYTAGSLEVRKTDYAERPTAPQVETETAASGWRWRMEAGRGGPEADRRAEEVERVVARSSFSDAFRCCLGPPGQGTKVELARSPPPVWERRPFLELED